MIFQKQRGCWMPLNLLFSKDCVIHFPPFYFTIGLLTALENFLVQEVKMQFVYKIHIALYSCPQYSYVQWDYTL